MRTGVPTVGDLVRLANTSPMYPKRPGVLLSRTTSGFVTVRWLNGDVSTGVAEWDVHLERVENLNDEEVAALMRAKLKGQV